MPTKIGRPLAWVRDDRDNEVKGLRQETVKIRDRKNPKKKPVERTRYYAYLDDQRRSKRYFGTDRNQAIFDFRQWQAQQADAAVDFAYPKTMSADDAAKAAQILRSFPSQRQRADEIEATGTMQINDHLPEDVFWLRVRNYLLDDPSLVAQKTGIKEIARLHTLPAPAKPLPLKTIIDEYVAGKHFKRKQQYRDAKTAWKLFTDAVAVGNLDDVRASHLPSYNRAIRALPAARTQKNVLVIVNTILNYAAALHNDHAPQVAQIKAAIKRLCKHDTIVKSNPKPWKVQEFHAMLDACKHDPLWTAVLITSVNLGLHGGEACELLKTEFDLDRSEVVGNRGKDGVARVAHLWDRTVTAIRAWQATDAYKANETPYLFSKFQDRAEGQKQYPLDIWIINRKIQRLRKKAGLGEHVTFDGLRDLMRRSAGAKNIVAIRWIMGHAMPGEDDTYAFRDPAETKEVLLKVEETVFAQPPKPVEPDAKPKGKPKKSRGKVK